MGGYVLKERGFPAAPLLAPKPLRRGWEAVRPSKLDASRVCPQPIHAVWSGKRARGRSLRPAVPLILLINKIVGHAGDVVTDDPGKRFQRGFLLVAWR